MIWQPIFGVVYLVGGIILAIFARLIAVWDYAYDLKWKILVMLGLRFRICFLRISGILFALMGFFVLATYLMAL
ncbi:MAG: hypothetical protein Q7R50_07370 [Dehalococcoidales bacterium]|nr:hypothetical protein [Dehalococcoidales bacterium]